MANSVDPILAVFIGSTLFASILNLSVMLCNYLQQTTSADDIFLCTLRVNLAELEISISLYVKTKMRNKRYFSSL